MKTIMKKKLIALSVYAIIAGGASYAPNAKATGIPAFDAAVNAVVTNQYVQSARQWAEQKAAMMAQMKNDIMMQMQQIQNDNNAFANVTTRITQMQTDTYNGQVAMAHEKDDFCETAATSKHIDDTACDREETKNSVKTNTVGKRLEEWGAVDQLVAAGVDSQRIKNSVINLRKKEVVDLISYCKEIQTDKSYSNPNEQELSYACTRFDFLIGGAKDGSTLSSKEVKAAEKTVELLVGIDGPMDLPPTTVTKPENDVAYARKMAYRALIAESLGGLVAIHSPPLLDPANPDKGYNEEEPSFMSALDEAIAKKFGSTDGVIDIAKINEGTSNGAVKDSAETLRLILFLEHLKYKQNMRIEALTAASLAYELEGLSIVD